MCREKLCFKQKCRPISTYEGCVLINQKVDYHLAHKINVINLKLFIKSKYHFINEKNAK